MVAHEKRVHITLQTANAQSRQSFRCSLKQYRELEEAADRKLEIWLHWMAAQHI